MKIKIIKNFLKQSKKLRNRIQLIKIKLYQSLMQNSIQLLKKTTIKS